jgi:hypothetical protein
MSKLPFRLFVLAGALSLAAVAGNAQTPRPTPRPLDPNGFPGEKSDRRPEFGDDPAEEMRARLALKAEQKDYDENLARAREAAELGTQVLDSYKANKALGAEEVKKLEKIEKLTKKIRNVAGGEDNDDQDVKLSGTLETAVKQVADLADELRKDVEKTPKHVISTVVIDRANDLIGLVKHVRDILH